MTGRVWAIDPGVRNAGTAELTFDGHRVSSIRTRHVESFTAETLEQTVLRMNRQTRLLVPDGRVEQCDACGHTTTRAPSDVVLAVLEARAYASDTAFAADSAWLWGKVVTILVGRGVPVATCPPSTLKAWAVHGKASKDELRIALQRLFPGVMAKTTHEVDAALLALAGAQRLGWFRGPDALRQGRHLGAMSWPKLPDTRPVPEAVSSS